MFAVKGWAVDATSLKPQVETFAARVTAGQNAEDQTSRKRKREAASTQPQQDIGKLWDRHMEGKKPSRPTERSKQDRKRKRKFEGKESLKELESADHHLANDEPKAGRKNSGSGKHTAEGVKRQKDAVSGEKNGTNVRSIGSNAVSKTSVKAASSKPAPANLTPMQAAMRQKLISARFRHLNETLYTAPSSKALQLFDQDPHMFEDYHSGFRQQVSVWPENPVDNFIAHLRSRGQIRAPKSHKQSRSKGNSSEAADGSSSALPRTHGTCVVADLGCGDARLASTLKESGDASTYNLRVHSFDLHSPSSLVTKADISDIPLADGSVDVAIACLALMGTNWLAFVEEAHRILHWKGEFWIAEIKSRFGRVGRARAPGRPVAHSVGGRKKKQQQQQQEKARETQRREAEEVDEQAALRVEVDGATEGRPVETDVSAFVDVLRRRGFVLKDGDRSVDLSNKMFVTFEFVKAATPVKGKGAVEAAAVGAGGGAGQGKTKKKFIDQTDQDVPTDDEVAVLNPCLYKIR